MMRSPNRMHEYSLVMHGKGIWSKMKGYVEMEYPEKPQVRGNFVYLRNTLICPLRKLWYIQVGNRVFYQEDI